MALLHAAQVLLPARATLLGGVLVNAQIHPEVRFLEVMPRQGAVGNPSPQEALVDQRLDDVDRRWRVRPGGEVDHVFGGGQGEPTFED